MGILKKLWDMLPEGRPVWVPQPAEWGIKEEIMEKNEDEKAESEKNEDEKAESEKTEEKQSEK